MLTSLIIILFIGLMLIAAGIGATAAGVLNFGMMFGIPGIVIVLADIIVMLMVRRRRAGLPE